MVNKNLMAAVIAGISFFSTVMPFRFFRSEVDEAREFFDERSRWIGGLYTACSRNLSPECLQIAQLFKNAEHTWNLKNRIRATEKTLAVIHNEYLTPILDQHKKELSDWEDMHQTDKDILTQAVRIISTRDNFDFERQLDIVQEDLAQASEL